MLRVTCRTALACIIFTVHMDILFLHYDVVYLYISETWV